VRSVVGIESDSRKEPGVGDAKNLYLKRWNGRLWLTVAGPCDAAGIAAAKEAAKEEKEARYAGFVGRKKHSEFYLGVKPPRPQFG
jgi:hypothetical protein